MKEYHLFYAPDVAEEKRLPEDEAAHAVRVLRMKEGDDLLVTDGQGNFYDCTITTASSHRCLRQINQQRPATTTWQAPIHIAVAPTKHMERMEWLVEKATEVGFDRLTLLACKNCSRRVVKTERLEKVAVAALKQSRKAHVPEVTPLTSFSAFLKQPFEGQKFIAHCYQMDSPDLPPNCRPKGTSKLPELRNVLSPNEPTLVAIGPEGDFTIDEVQAAIAAGFKPISLGSSRLRTETAALIAVVQMNMAKTPTER